MERAQNKALNADRKIFLQVSDRPGASCMEGRDKSRKHEGGGGARLGEDSSSRGGVSSKEKRRWCMHVLVLVLACIVVFFPSWPRDSKILNPKPLNQARGRFIGPEPNRGLRQHCPDWQSTRDAGG